MGTDKAVMSERRRPSLLRIIDSDYAAALVILLAILLWLLFWLLSIMQLVDLLIPRSLVIGLTAASLLLLAWRCWLISRIFASGVETAGEVEQISFYRDRGRIRLSFDWGGQKLQRNSTIPKNEYTESLRQGQKIPLIIDPNQPKRVFLRDLYLRK